MRRLVLVAVVAIVLAWQASHAIAICPEGESLYFTWQTAVITMDVKQIEYDIATSNLNTALEVLGQKQQEAVQHLQGHANCGVYETCWTAEQIQLTILGLQDIVDDKCRAQNTAQYALDSAIATEQSAWWAIAAHFEFCPECD